MKLFKAATAVLGMAFLGAAFSPTAKADDYNHKTIVTFSAPVEIPPVYITGMRILPAGTYVFKLMSPSPIATLSRFSTRTRPRLSPLSWRSRTIELRRKTRP